MSTDADLWPTNGQTITCTAIDAILFLITILIFILFCSKSSQYRKIDEASKRCPHSPSVSSPSHHSKSTKSNTDDGPTQQQLDAHRSIDAFVFYGTCISCTFVLLSNISTFLYTINSQHYYCCARLLTYTQISTIGIAKILCHLIFVRRLYITFQSSPALRYPMFVFIIFYTLFFIAVFIIIITILFIAISFHIYFVYIAASLFCGDFIVSIVVLLLFILKLKIVVMQRLEYDMHDSTKAIQFSAPDNLLLGTITKLTLLSSINALSSLLLFVLFGIRAFVNINDENIWKIIYFVNVFFMFTGLANLMSLYLIMSFATSHYVMFCECLHNLIQRCCAYGISGSLIRRQKTFIKQQSMDIQSVDQPDFSA